MSERTASQGSKVSPLRVIIVDDSEETRKSIQMMMSLVPDSEVVAFGQNGREAIALVRQHQPDVALIDVNMPVMDGLTAIQTIRPEYPDLICIVISAEKDSPTLQRAVAVGAQGYLIKPVTAEQLLSVMERVSKTARATRTQTRTQMRTQAPARPSAPLPTPSAPPQPNLEALATQYAKARRADDQAIQVFERLAEQPDCSQRWLLTLAMLYIVRKQWPKLKMLATRLEQTGQATLPRPATPQTAALLSNLEAMAARYARARRADDQAIQVFEALAAQPNCKQRWLMTLAMLYVVRKQWSKLKALAARLEQATHSRAE
ncbi:MAG: response regulator [Anaerolineae bacterium]|nr:response regulator [Anaerolineae bacterium]